jgi:hypothetical protein
MPRITAAEARRIGNDKTVEQLVDQASDWITNAAPHAKSVTLTGADDPAWATGHTMKSEKLLAVADILRGYGFEVTYFWNNVERGHRAGTIIDWSEKR